MKKPRKAKVPKIRTTVWLPENVVAELRERSEVTGVPMAEMFRRAVIAYLKEKP